MGKNYAVCIGINRYNNLQPLRYAQRDAEAMRDYFGQELGFWRMDCFAEGLPPIASDYGPAIASLPTYGTLRRFLRVRFEQPFLNAGDNLWFFFAGHGVRHEGHDYLMPVDGDPGDVAATGILLNDVTSRLRRSGADNVVLLIDACRNDGRRDGVGVGSETQQGVIGLFACSPNESSYEIEPLQQGAFTYALLESLRLQGEGNCATVERLYHRLRDRVPTLNQHYQKPRQTPYGQIEPPSKYHLILLPRLANVADVLALKNDALMAEVSGNYALAEQFWTRVLAVSGADGDAIAAIKRLARLELSSPAPIPVPSPAPAPPAPSRSAKPASTPPPKQTFSFEVITVNDQGEPSQRSTHEVEYYRETLGECVALDLVKIPAGSFVMGAPESEEEGQDKERPQHRVTVPSFWLGKYAVTQTQYEVVMSNNPSRFKGENRPVEQVSWHDAIAFCTELSQQTGKTYRLPSEAEWEYACRAGTTAPFYFGDIITPDFVNYDGNYQYNNSPKGQYREQTTEVGIFPPNAFGLYEMHGNVWEWCQDHGHASYESAPSDGSAWIDKNAKEDNTRILRGGSWYNYPRDCRSATRSDDFPRSADFNFGFRVVCSAP